MGGVAFRLAELFACLDDELYGGNREQDHHHEQVPTEQEGARDESMFAAPSVVLSVQCEPQAPVLDQEVPHVTASDLSSIRLTTSTVASSTTLQCELGSHPDAIHAAITIVYRFAPGRP